MWWLLVILLTLTIVNFVPSPGKSEKNDGDMEYVTDPDEEIDSSSPWNEGNVNPSDGKISLFDSSLDSCASNLQGSNNIYRRKNAECRTKPEAAIKTPESPREGVTPFPAWLNPKSFQKSDPECVNFWQRPKFVTCGGPETFTDRYDIYDSVLVMNCVPGETESIPERGEFEFTEVLGRYCCSRFDDVGPQWLAFSCAKLAPPPEPDGTTRSDAVDRMNINEWIAWQNSKRRAPPLDQTRPSDTWWDWLKRTLKLP